MTLVLDQQFQIINAGYNSSFGSPKVPRNNGEDRNLDTIASLFAAINNLEHDNIKNPQEFRAQVLYAQRYTDVADFTRVFGIPKNSPFSKYIFNAEEAPSTGTVIKIYVTIPMITAMLPYPDLDLIDRATDILTEGDPEIIKQQKMMLSKAKKEFDKILLYPCAFSLVTKQTAVPKPGDICLVSLPNSSKPFFPSNFAMKYAGSESEIWKQ